MVAYAVTQELGRRQEDQEFKTSLHKGLSQNKQETLQNWKDGLAGEVLAW